jgi:phenylacetic acid degradation operon negative regulatory protein
VHARSALFDLYGDHLRRLSRNQPGAPTQAPVAALVRLLRPLGLQPPAVRTAVSRMVRQGWLQAVRLDAGPGYALTPRAARRVDAAAERVYRSAAPAWDARWHLVLVHPPVTVRADRERLHASLAFEGYGPLGGGAWVAPRPSVELDQVLAEAGARAERFTAEHDGDSQLLAGRAWDLDALARSYSRFLAEQQETMAVADTSTDEGAFAARSVLVHEYRKFLFVDPDLPLALLPADWPGTKASAWFGEQAALLLPAARRFIADCLHP